MEENKFRDIVDIAKVGPYIVFKNNIIKYSYNIILISSLNSWYSVFTKRCSYCEQPITITEKGEFIIYNCYKCNKRNSNYYLHLDEEYVKKTFMNMLVKQ